MSVVVQHLKANYTQSNQIVGEKGSLHLSSLAPTVHFILVLLLLYALPVIKWSGEYKLGPIPFRNLTLKIINATFDYTN